MLEQINSGNDDLVVITGMSTYAQEGDAILNPAGSGGAVFTKDGKLVGLSVASASTLTTDQAETEFGIDIINATPGTRLQVEYVEPIVRDTVATSSTASRGHSGHC